MTITIRLKTDNAAFSDNKDAEVQRILTEAFRDYPRVPSVLRDYNGNGVGQVKVTGK